MLRLLRLCFGFGLLLVCLGVARANVDIPVLSRTVTDLTATLSASQIQRLDDTLAAFEARKGSQIAVLIVPSTQPEDIAQFGIRVAEAWRIGRENVDDGVMLIIAKDDRQMRIEVGYGLEGAIPDAIAKRVIDDIIAPYFKQGDFAGGISAGVARLIGLIDGEPLPAPPTVSPAEQSGNTVLFVLAAGAVLGIVLSILLGRVLGGLVAGLGSGAVALLFLGLSLSMAAMIALMIFFLIGVRQTGRRGWSNGRGGVFGSGGSGGSSWSGGGGGFGGGGASGSW